jgi:hypothetical protein
MIKIALILSILELFSSSIKKLIENWFQYGRHGGSVGGMVAQWEAWWLSGSYGG